MTSSSRRAVALALGMLVAACGSPPSVQVADAGAGDAGVDAPQPVDAAGLADAPPADAGAVIDAAPIIDAMPSPDACVSCDKMGTCADLASDPLHCGACEHDCLGGACTAGVCQPVELANLTTGLKGVVVDGTHVYWAHTGDSSLHRRMKDGSAPAETLVPTGTLYALRGPALDATHVYYTDMICCNVGLRMWRVLKGGGIPELLGTWSFSGGPAVNVALDATSVYVGAVPLGTIGAFPKSGGPPLIVTTNAPSVQTVIVDATDVYFGAETADGVMPAVVGRVPKDGTGSVTPVLTVPLPATPFAVADFGDALYVGSWNIMGGPGMGSLTRVSKATGVATVVAPGDVSDMAVDAAGVVWASYFAGTVYKLDPTGTDSLVVISGYPNVIAVAIDANSVYFATQPGPGVVGTLYRVAR